MRTGYGRHERAEARRDREIEGYVAWAEMQPGEVDWDDWLAARADAELGHQP